ncbi:MAG: hypothetical protein HY308_00265 [Gammaproteobacteria bacterium]|nr:hypothetical protein [Gammaproteobacteria bacterium]
MKYSRTRVAATRWNNGRNDQRPMKNMSTITNALLPSANASVSPIACC